MQAQGGGQIVNVISGIAFSPMAYQTRYAATKAALDALSLALRYEFWDDQIKVSSATPELLRPPSGEISAHRSPRKPRSNPLNGYSPE